MSFALRRSHPPPDAATALAAYTAGLFPMDDPARQHEPLAWYHADPRAVFDLDEAARARTRRAVRRSLAKAGEGWELRINRDPLAVIDGCAQPRPGDGVWLTPRLCELYRELLDVGALRSFELWVDGALGAGMVGVALGRAVMLESMFHTVGHAGNVLVARTLDRLATDDIELCDVQLATDHTRRLGVVEVAETEYHRRLAEALR